MTKRHAKRKGPKFRVGQVVSLPMRVVKVDCRYKPTRYNLHSLVVGWAMEDPVGEHEITAHERGGK